VPSPMPLTFTLTHHVSAEANFSQTSMPFLTTSIKTNSGERSLVRRGCERHWSTRRTLARDRRRRRDRAA
jgi:hypothetical protein